MIFRLLGCLQVVASVSNALAAIKASGDDGVVYGLIATLFAGLAAWSLTAKENPRPNP